MILGNVYAVGREAAIDGPRTGEQDIFRPAGGGEIEHPIGAINDGFRHAPVQSLGLRGRVKA